MDKSQLERLRKFAARHWEDEIVPELTEYIRIPCKSPLFDPDWEQHGHMDRAVEQFVRWSKTQSIDGLNLEVFRLPGRTPLILIEIPGKTENTVLLYGHLDKQPEMTGWRTGLGPWSPKLEGERLYGRGAADDGYALFASLSAIRSLQEQQLPHARCLVLIESSEESGSPDLPHYMEALSARIGSPELVICLDSSCGNYDRLWYSTSLRGMTGGVLSVEVMEEGVHSGNAGGVVPCSFRILRELLSRIEDSKTGNILLDSCHTRIPEHRLAEARLAAAVLGETVWNQFPLSTSMQAETDDPVELVLNRSWRPALAVTGMDGLPTVANAGNVLRSYSALKLALRLPPTCAAETVLTELERKLLSHPPYGAKLRFKPDCAATGWHAEQLSPWLDAALQQSSRAMFGQPAMPLGDGVTIPFMNMLANAFPDAQFLVTGVLGPESNAHGPNEFLHLEFARRLSACIAVVLAEHCQAVN